MAISHEYLSSKGVKVAALSCNALNEHNAWVSPNHHDMWIVDFSLLQRCWAMLDLQILDLPMFPGLCDDIIPALLDAGCGVSLLK